MRIGVDGRVLVHRPTGVARYLKGILDHREPPAEGEEEVRIFVDRKPDEAVQHTLEVAPWPFPGGDPLWRQLALPKALTRSKVDVLYCPFYSIPLRARVPAVVTIHDVSFLAHPEWFRRRSRWAFSLSAPSARRASKILTVSEFSAREIVARMNVPASKIVVTPLGVSPRFFAAPSESERRSLRQWLGCEGPYVLHFGAVHARRHVDLLVAGFARLRHRHRDAKLVICGPDLAPAPDIEAAARDLGVTDALIRKTWVPHEHVVALLHEAGVLAYLSSYEGFGLPALEALAAGAPVVALRRASLPEVLGDTCIWLDSLDADRLGEALGEALRDDVADDLRKRGRRRAQTFTWRRSAESTWPIIRAAAAQGV